MKQRICLWMALCLSFLLTGCELLLQAGPGLTTGRDEYLKSIKPYLQYWDKPGITPEGRREDSVGCGASGDSSDRAGIGSARIKAAQRPGETERETETRLRQDWANCMRGKGYRYVTPTR
jgi:hypothetical protein